MLKLSTNQIDSLMAKDKLYSLRALSSPRYGATVAKWISGIGITFFIILFFPWQQNIRGKGQITALNPMNRPQTIESVIGGRIQKWHVQEGQFVEKGDTIVTLTEVKEKYFDPLFLERLNQQIQAKQNGLISKQHKIQALQRQINALKETAKNKLQQAAAKLEADRIRFENAENQFQRNKKLFEAGNIPLTKFQDLEYKYQGSLAEYENAKTEINRVKAEYDEKISKVESDYSSTYAELYESQSELVKLNNEFSNMQIRNTQYQILATQAGIIVKALKQGIGETLKEGEAVCTIMPNTNHDLAVEMYIRAMDVPLISIGRKVRVEFDGWPALQFSGWPSVSVGTFGGTVAVIDYLNSKPGEFRILVVPDKEDEPWPTKLRIGSGTKGWVMLDDVPVWYEIWRQLNGFPPSLYEEPLDDVLNKKQESDETK
jgi:multidrug resistance efflux pump